MAIDDLTYSTIMDGDHVRMRLSSGKRLRRHNAKLFRFREKASRRLKEETNFCNKWTPPPEKDEERKAKDEELKKKLQENQKPKTTERVPTGTLLEPCKKLYTHRNLRIIELKP